MENKEKKMLTTEDLNRTLGKKELYSIAFGHVIGSGVFSLIGIGIGYTGKSAWIGILLSAVFILLQALPFIVMAGTARFRGGYYSMMGTLWGPKFAGFYIVIFFASNVSLAMYAISFAQYLQGVLPQVPIVPVAVACLTVFFITNLLGIEGAAKLEIVMDIVLALAMTCFIVFGLPKVDYSTLFTVDFAPAGPMGIITCAVLLTWATAGGIDMVNPECRGQEPHQGSAPGHPGGYHCHRNLLCPDCHGGRRRAPRLRDGQPASGPGGQGDHAHSRVPVLRHRRRPVGPDYDSERHLRMDHQAHPTGLQRRLAAP